jgi:LysM repeat protein
MRYAIFLQIVISFACLLLILLLWSRGPVVHKEDVGSFLDGKNTLGTSSNVVSSFVEGPVSDKDKRVLLTAEKIIDEPASQKVYVVKSGDTLGHIAQRFGLSVARLKVMNNLQSDVITVGKELRVSEAQ